MNRMIPVLLFLVSFVYMALEMLSVRIITPYFGNTIYTWGSIISVFLIGSSFGYWCGGISADGEDRDRWIKKYFISCSIVIAFLPYLADQVLPYFRDSMNEIGVFIGVAVLFILPNVLLSALIPGLTKMVLTEQFNGRKIGSLHMVSSMGSVIGTLVTTFILLPNFHVNVILSILIFILVSSFNGFILFTSKKVVSILLFLICLVPFLVQVKLFSDVELIDRVSSPYHELFITESKRYRGEEGNYRFLQFNTGGYQGGIDLNDPDRYVFPYVRNISDLVDGYFPSSQNIYMIGHGVGSLTKKLKVSGKEIEVAELDEKVLEVSKKYFGYQGNDVKIGDGRVLLGSKENNSLDVLILDAYSGGTIPFHLTTREFFQVTRQKLKPEGIIIMNVIGKVSDDDLVEGFQATVKSIYPYVKWYASNPSSKSLQNLFVVASSRVLGEATITESKEIPSISEGKIIHDKDTNFVELN